MLESSPGLKSRFSSYLYFDDWTPQKCVAFICKLTAKEEPLPFSLNATGRQVLQDGFLEIIKRPGWANARDAIHLYKQIMKERDIRKAKATSSIDDNASSMICAEDISKAISTMLHARPASLVSASEDDLSGSGAPVQVQQKQDTSNMQLHKERDIPQEGEATSAIESKEMEEGGAWCDENGSEESPKGADGVHLYSGLLQKIGELESRFSSDASDEHAKEFTHERQRLERENAEVEKLAKDVRNAHKRSNTAKNVQSRICLRTMAKRKEKALRKKLEKESKRQAIVSALMSIGLCPAGF